MVLVRHKSASLIRLKCIPDGIGTYDLPLWNTPFYLLGHCFIIDMCSPTYTDYTVLHSPHYIAEVTFEDVEPTEFVF